MDTIKNRLTKYATALILIWFIFKPLSDISFSKSYLEMPNGEFEITRQELNDFLEVWGNMMQSSFGKSFEGASLKSENEYPENLKKWLKLQRWNIERFFYDEQRIRDLVKYAEIKQQLRDNKKIAKSSLINLKSINKNLEKSMDAIPYRMAELELIEANLYQITEILAGKAILKQ